MARRLVENDKQKNRQEEIEMQFEPTSFPITDSNEDSFIWKN